MGTVGNPARFASLAMTFWMAAVTQALAHWDNLGDLQLHHGGQRFLRDVPLNEPAEGLRLTASDDDIFCRTISATIGNGQIREIYHGLLHREQPQDVDLAQLGQPIRRLSFQCGAQHFDTAVLHIRADIGS